jgi:hypothetical protein
MEEPRIRVGICDRYPRLAGTLHGCYRLGGAPVTGDFTAEPAPGVVILRDGFGREIFRAPEIHLAAENGGTFTLQGVTIGVRFHWERQAAQTFAGDMTLLATAEEALTAINDIPLEDYLASVVSSEMSDEAPAAFLQAHAVASRSWLVAMLLKKAAPPAERAAPPPRRRGRMKSSAGTIGRITTTSTSVPTTTASGIRALRVGHREGRAMRS